MPRRHKPIAKTSPAEDLSFPPPYEEQAKYVQLANTFLSRNGDSAEHSHTSPDKGEEKPARRNKSRNAA